MTAEEFRQINIDACKRRHACAKGYAQLLRADSTTAILRVWRNWWSEFYKGMFFDDIKEYINDAYESLKDDFQTLGIYVNEPCEKGFVIANKYRKKLTIGGNIKVYVFGGSNIVAKNNAQVYCNTKGSKIELRDYAYGNVVGSAVIARDHSKLFLRDGKATCFNAANVTVYGGELQDNGHYRIQAMGDAIVYSNSNNRIILSGNATKKMKNEESLNNRNNQNIQNIQNIQNNQKQ